MQTTETSTNIYDPRLWQRFWQITRLYWHSEEKWRARGVFALMLLLLAASAAISVKLSYINRDFTTALGNLDGNAFKQGLLLYLAVFAVATPVEVYKTYVQKTLSTDWRQWLTTHFLGKYFTGRAYYHIGNDAGVDNPDQRISCNIKDFTGMTLDHVFTIFASVLGFVSFVGIIWSISSKLVLVLLVYAVIGTIVTMWLGNRLLSLNVQAQQKGADFRYGLVHIRDNVEAIAFYQGEEREKRQVRGRLRDAIDVNLKLIGWQRNLSFFTTGYNYIPLALPFVVLSPEYFSGRIELGTLMQAFGASFTVLKSLAVIVDQFNGLSGFAAAITRVETLAAALDRPADGNRPLGATTIDSREASRLALDNVTLLTPDYRRTLVRNATAALSPGTGLLIAGASGAGKSSVLRAMAGLWNAGEGQIFRPPLQEMLFLPQRPYMIRGSLREQLIYPNMDRTVPDGDLKDILEKVNLANLHERCGGLDIVMEWGQLLSLGEQQRLAFARLLITAPRYAVLDEATSALDVANEARLYEQLQESGMSYVSVGHRPSLHAFHDDVLELKGAGEWRLVPAEEFQAAAS